MDCKAFRREIEEAGMGESLSLMAQAHVDSCAACRTFQSERLSLRQLVGSLKAVGAPPDFDFRLRARLAAAKSADSRSVHRTRFAPGLKAISVAASFALLIAAGVVFRQLQSSQSNAPAATENSSLAKASDGRPANFDGAGQLTNGSNASQGREVAGVENNSAAPKTGGASPSGGGVERTVRAKSTRNATPTRANRPPIFSNDLAFRNNPTVITPAVPSATNVAGEQNASAPLSVSSQPFKVLLHDRQGALRSVSLEPVIFGSQNFLERAAQKHSPASEVEGIW